MCEFKAKIARHSNAMAKIFNAEIVHFTCRVTNHGLFSTSLAGDELFSGMSDESKGCGIRRMSMSDLGFYFRLPNFNRYVLINIFCKYHQEQE